MTTFTDRIKELRKSKNMTQKQMAQALGIAERNYQRYEASENNPSSQMLITIADYFNVSTDYLLGRSDSPTRL